MWHHLVTGIITVCFIFTVGAFNIIYNVCIFHNRATVWCKQMYVVVTVFNKEIETII